MRSDRPPKRVARRKARGLLPRYKKHRGGEGEFGRIFRWVLLLEGLGFSDDEVWYARIYKRYMSIKKMSTVELLNCILHSETLFVEKNKVFDWKSGKNSHVHPSIVQGQMCKPPSEPWHLSPPDSRYMWLFLFHMVLIVTCGSRHGWNIVFVWCFVVSCADFKHHLFPHHFHLAFLKHHCFREIFFLRNPTRQDLQDLTISCETFASGGEKFRASISFCNLRLQASQRIWRVMIDEHVFFFPIGSMVWNILPTFSIYI